MQSSQSQKPQNVLQKYQHCLVNQPRKEKNSKAAPYPTFSISSDDPPRPFANSPQLWAGPQKLSFFPLRNPNVCTAIERTQKTWSHLQALHCGGKIAKIAVLDKNLQKNWSHLCQYLPSPKENIASQITKTTTTHLLQNLQNPSKLSTSQNSKFFNNGGLLLLTDCQEQNLLMILSVSYNKSMNPQMKCNSGNLSYVSFSSCKLESKELTN